MEDPTGLRDVIEHYKNIVAENKEMQERIKAVEEHNRKLCLRTTELTAAIKEMDGEYEEQIGIMQGRVKYMERVMKELYEESSDARRVKLIKAALTMLAAGKDIVVDFMKAPL